MTRSQPVFALPALALSLIAAGLLTACGSKPAAEVAAAPTTAPTAALPAAAPEQVVADLAVDLAAPDHEAAGADVAEHGDLAIELVLLLLRLLFKNIALDIGALLSHLDINST